MKNSYKIVLIFYAAALVALISPRAFSFFNLLPLVLVGVTILKDKSLIKSINFKTIVWFSLPFLLALISSLWSIDFDYAIERSLKILPQLLLGGVAVLGSLYVFKDIEHEKLIKHAPLFLGGVIFLLVLEHALGTPIARIIYSNDENFSHLAFYNRRVVALGFLAVPFAYFALKNQQKKTAIFILAGIFALLFFTRSQSAQLSVLIGVLSIFMPWHMKQFRWSIFAIIVVITVTMPWSVQYLFHQIASDIDNMPLIRYASPANRLEIWDYVSRYALQNPLYGFGVEATRMVEEFDTQEIFQHGKTILHPHNMALQIWIEFGAIGLLVFSAILFRIFKFMDTLLPREQTLGFAMMGMWFSVAMVGYGMWQGWWIGFTIFLMILFAIFKNLLPKQ